MGFVVDPTMEWIQRNPKKALGVAALAVLAAVMILRGMSGGSHEDATLGPPLATPTATPAHQLSALPSGTPTAEPSSVGDLMKSLSPEPKSAQFGSYGTGAAHSLHHRRVVIEAGSDGPLRGVGWRIPLADGKRQGSDTSHARTFRHADTTWGDRGLAWMLVLAGPSAHKTWCSVTVDGKVVERQEAKGPWASVDCQG